MGPFPFKILLLKWHHEQKQEEDQEAPWSRLPWTWSYWQAQEASWRSRKRWWQHHHRINFDKYHPGYFGKVGMRNFHVHPNDPIHYCPTINLDKLWSLVSEQTRVKYEKNDKKAPVIDISRAGYFKVLGRGLLPKQPVIVKARFFSRIAEEKIKAVGGACILTA